ncbi:MAG: hypothetical protein JNL10_06765 [Verrucomicrobiales bacterium]|nr:hypothetical protein [Verrucomicrobiales bacterium]
MNSNDPLETLLASRTPRKVSPGLHARLFGSRTAVPEVAGIARGMSWLMPALGTAVIVGSIFLHPVVQSGPAPGGTNSALLAAYSASAAQSAQNSLPLAGFTWTNTAPEPSANESQGGLN